MRPQIRRKESVWSNGRNQSYVSNFVICFIFWNQGVFRGNDLTLELTGPPEPSLVTSLLAAGPERANCEAHPAQEFANLFSDSVSNLFFGHSCHLSTDHASPSTVSNAGNDQICEERVLTEDAPFFALAESPVALYVSPSPHKSQLPPQPDSAMSLPN